MRPCLRRRCSRPTLARLTGANYQLRGSFGSKGREPTASRHSYVVSASLTLLVLTTHRCASPLFGASRVIGPFLLGALSSLLAAFAIWAIYIAVLQSARDVASLECWWNPDFQTWRIVIRNINSDFTLLDTTYRAWYRLYHRAANNATVITYDDHLLSDGNRVVLPRSQDLPLLCFRLAESAGALVMIVTDKLGVQSARIELRSEQNQAILCEYSTHVVVWRLFKISISRLFMLPDHVELEEGHPKDVFRSLLARQQQIEHKVPLVFQHTHELTISM